MKVYIDKVNLGATYMEKTYDYFIYGKTESRKEVIIFDDKFNLRDYQGRAVECLINAFMVHNINFINENEEYNPRQPTLEGTFIGKYVIPKKWDACKNQYEFLYKGERNAVETEDGIMIIDPTEFKVPINEGDYITFKVGRLDLMDWLPIEE